MKTLHRTLHAHTIKGMFSLSALVWISLVASCVIGGCDDSLEFSTSLQEPSMVQGEPTPMDRDINKTDTSQSHHPTSSALPSGLLIDPHFHTLFAPDELGLDSRHLALHRLLLRLQPLEGSGELDGVQPAREVGVLRGGVDRRGRAATAQHAHHVRQRRLRAVLCRGRAAVRARAQAVRVAARRRGGAGAGASLKRTHVAVCNRCPSLPIGSIGGGGCFGSHPYVLG